MYEKPFTWNYLEVEYPVHKYEAANNSENLAVGAVTEISAIEAVSASLGSTAALDRWREFSEILKKRQLAAQINNGPEMTEEQINNLHYYSNQTMKKSYQYDQEALSTDMFQSEYEQDKVDISQRYDPSVLSFQRYLSTVNHPMEGEEKNIRDYNSTEHVFDKAQNKTELQVKEVMQQKIKAILDSTPIEMAASLLNRNALAILPVVDMHRKLVGVIGMNEILNQILDSQSLSEFVVEADGRVIEQKALALLEEPVRKYMNPNPITVSPYTTVQEACSILLERGVNQLIVIENGVIRGLFSTKDALKVLIHRLQLA